MKGKKSNKRWSGSLWKGCIGQVVGLRDEMTCRIFFVVSLENCVSKGGGDP